MANPFAVEVPNLMQAMLYGEQGFERVRKQRKDAATEAGRLNALQRMMAGDVQGAFGEALGIGDTDAAKALATYSESQANRAFREADAQRQQANADRSYGLQRAQLDATLAGQRVPSGFQRGADGNVTFIPGGPADPDYLKRVNSAKTEATAFENEQKLRKEWEGNSKTYLDVRRAHERILASKDDAAGDISLIFGYMRMLDPASVVREGEYATASNAAGVPDQLRNLYNRAIDGTRLNPNQRDMFKGQAGALYETASREHTAREGQMRGIAKAYGLDDNRIITQLGPETAPSPLPGNVPAPPPGFDLVR